LRWHSINTLKCQAFITPNAALSCLRLFINFIPFILVSVNTISSLYLKTIFNLFFLNLKPMNFFKYWIFFCLIILGVSTKKQGITFYSWINDWFYIKSYIAHYLYITFYWYLYLSITGDCYHFFLLKLELNKESSYHSLKIIAESLSIAVSYTSNDF